MRRLRAPLWRIADQLRKTSGDDGCLRLVQSIEYIGPAEEIDADTLLSPGLAAPVTGKTGSIVQKFVSEPHGLPSTCLHGVKTGQYWTGVCPAKRVAGVCR